MDHGTMDHGSHTTTSAMPTSTDSMDMGDMDHSSHGGGGACEVSMMWNWNTINSCFISESWHVTSRGMFAGSCIGVLFLAMLLEFLRRGLKEYDRFIIRQHHARSLDAASAAASPACSDGDKACATGAVAAAGAFIPPFRPSVWQQAVRASLHMAQFAVAYFLMLLAMYYNGYIIICIFIGVYIGGFIFQWETLSGGSHDSRTSSANDVTVCCG